MLDIFQMKDLARALGVVLSILCMHSAGAARHHSSQTKRILVLGDSLSEGFGLKSSQAYPALLAEKLRAADLNFEITNASASGGTTDGGLRRLPPHLKHKIDIFILEL
jgi:acyl-CoA thioesterase-1